jgi:ribosomal protein L37E
MNRTAIPPESSDMPAGPSWRHLRQLQMLGCASLVGPLLVFVVVGVPLAKFARVPLWVFPALWLIACAALTHYLGDFRCPRCGKTFYRGRWYYVSQCVHCGLPEEADSAESTQSQTTPQSP